MAILATETVGAKSARLKDGTTIIAGDGISIERQGQNVLLTGEGLDLQTIKTAKVQKASISSTPLTITFPTPLPSGLSYQVWVIACFGTIAGGTVYDAPLITNITQTGCTASSQYDGMTLLYIPIAYEP